MTLSLTRPEAGVHLAFCHGGDVRGNWALHYGVLRAHDAVTRGLIKSVGVSQGLYIAKNRNDIVRRFLDDCRETYLMFMDHDNPFEVTQFYQLYDAAVKHRTPILGAWYCSFMGDGIQCTWLERKSDGTMGTVTKFTGEVQEVSGGAVGMGFTLIHRNVLEAMRKAMPRNNAAWFGHDDRVNEQGDTESLGEDTTFCLRALALGFKTYGHSGICIGHDKRIVLDVERFNYELERQRWQKDQTRQAG